MDSQLSHVTAFSGAPEKWGLLLRTIDVRPRQLTCIATSAQRIVAAYEDIVNIYDAVTFVLQQSLRIPETVTKIQGSPDGSTLFFAHSHSVTMWDVQTGGLTHTFTTQSEINDIAVSMTGDRIACGSSDGSIAFWNTHTKEEGEGFGNGQPVVAIFWLSPRKLAVATPGTVYTHDIDVGETPGYSFIPGRVWGMVYSPSNGGELLVGAFAVGQRGGPEFELPQDHHIRPGTCTGISGAETTLYSVTDVFRGGTVESHACGQCDGVHNPAEEEYGRSISHHGIADRQSSAPRMRLHPWPYR
jgi:WD40 repeat protein